MIIENSGLKNDQIITELLLSGSAAIDTKNQTGVYMFDDADITDGIIYDTVTKPKYNQNELEKVVDTSIVELLPSEENLEQTTVLKELYDAKIAEVELLTLENEDLRNKLGTSEATITGLQNTLENALIDLDQKDLLLAAAENQSKQSNEKVSSTVKELQNAIQRATAESIERSKLAANNNALLDQLKTFKKQLDQAAKSIELANQTIAQTRASRDSVQAIVDGLQAQNSLLRTQLEDVKQTKSKKIICTESYRQGLMPEHIFSADKKFGLYMYRNHREVMEGYSLWATPIVELMKKNPRGSKIFYNLIVKHWSEHMAYRMNVLPTDNKFGNFLHKYGTKFSKLVYTIYQIKNQYKPVVSYA